jgi:hypothetical protein
MIKLWHSKDLKKIVICLSKKEMDNSNVYEPEESHLEVHVSCYMVM